MRNELHELTRMKIKFQVSAFSFSAFQLFVFQFRIPHSAFRISFAVSP